MTASKDPLSFYKLSFGAGFELNHHKYTYIINWDSQFYHLYLSQGQFYIKIHRSTLNLLCSAAPMHIRSFCHSLNRGANIYKSLEALSERYRFPLWWHTSYRQRCCFGRSLRRTNFNSFSISLQIRPDISARVELLISSAHTHNPNCLQLLSNVNYSGFRVYLAHD